MTAPPPRLIALLDAWEWGAAHDPHPSVAEIVERCHVRYRALKSQGMSFSDALILAQAEAIMEVVGNKFGMIGYDEG